MPTNTNFILIRHAEKPEDDENYNGLSEAGHARSWAYVAYFQNFKIGPNPIRFDHLFATAHSAKSNRPFLTLEPLAQHLGLTVINHYENTADDIVALANYLLIDPTFNNSSILICWHHGQLLKLAEKLGVKKAALPYDWPETVFGRLIQISFDANGQLLEPVVIHQKLMYTDRES